MHFVVVQTAEGRGSPGTRQALDFFNGLDITAETLEKGSKAAGELWEQAEGHFGRRKREGFPLVVLLDGESVAWACSAPTRKQLKRARELMRSAPTTSVA